MKIARRQSRAAHHIAQLGMASSLRASRKRHGASSWHQWHVALRRNDEIRQTVRRNGNRGNDVSRSTSRRHHRRGSNISLVVCRGTARRHQRVSGARIAHSRRAFRTVLAVCAAHRISDKMAGGHQRHGIAHQHRGDGASWQSFLRRAGETGRWQNNKQMECVGNNDDKYQTWRALFQINKRHLFCARSLA